MTESLHIPAELVSRCAAWSKELERLPDQSARIAHMERVFPGILSDLALLRGILRNITACADYPDIYYATMFDSEIILYRDPGRQFSLRMYLWDRGEYDPVHDHNSWGVIGPALGTLEVINYRREDEGMVQDHIRLVESSRKIIQPGGTFSVLPLDAGIHRTGNPGDNAAIQLSVYGQKLTGRDHVNTFDLNTGRISPLYPPPVKKRLLAEKVLAFMEH